MLMIPAQRINNFNYYSVGSLACIVLLLSGFIQYYFSMTNLSFANRAYGQEQTVEVEDGRVNLAHGQEQTVEVEDGRVNLAHGQEQTVEVDDERSEDSS